MNVAVTYLIISFLIVSCFGAETMAFAKSAITPNLKALGPETQKKTATIPGSAGGSPAFKIADVRSKSQQDASENSEEHRRTISLDGTWQIADGSLKDPPSQFERAIPVPGLVDMATPPFAETGFKSKLREAFWYRRKFQVSEPIPPTALLKINKAMFGAKMFLNGKLLGEHLPSFTPATFDVSTSLHPGENELTIRIGAFTDVIPKPIPSGWDYEKEKFTPGIFDSVELILTGEPYIERVQAVPNIENKSVTVYSWVAPSEIKNNSETPNLTSKKHDSKSTRIHITVREVSTGKIAGEGDCQIGTNNSGKNSKETNGKTKNLINGAAGATKPTAQVTIPIAQSHLWSPEDPFLYELEAKSDGDTLKTRFGMRSFKLDPQTGHAVLNGKPYFMRGSNITLYRFFEDADRGNKPWDPTWVRRLHKECRNMHWNTLRYCIGFPPEFWYKIADEEGILIQDEFPIWNMDAKKGDYDPKELASEYKDWMQERWNHPCVVIWDASNETRSAEIAKAITMVRKLDYSNRPWDNGWSLPLLATDSREQHPYHFQDPNFKLPQISTDPGNAGWKQGESPVIVNEYGWLWLNRDGTPTALTRELYQNLLGANASTEERRELYARLTAAETEFWRCHRSLAAVMHFCVLGYSRPGNTESPKSGATSDHWLDVEKLTWEPKFRKYVRDSFAPVGLMIDAWESYYQGGTKKEIPVVVINDLENDWKGTLRLRIVKIESPGTPNISKSTLWQEQLPCELPAYGKKTLKFDVAMPPKTGKYQFEATLLDEKENDAKENAVRSLRDFIITSP